MLCSCAQRLCPAHDRPSAAAAATAGPSISVHACACHRQHWAAAMFGKSLPTAAVADVVFSSSSSSSSISSSMNSSSNRRRRRRRSCRRLAVIVSVDTCIPVHGRAASSALGGRRPSGCGSQSAAHRGASAGQVTPTMLSIPGASCRTRAGVHRRSRLLLSSSLHFEAAAAGIDGPHRALNWDPFWLAMATIPLDLAVIALSAANSFASSDTAQHCMIRSLANRIFPSN